MSRWLPCTFRGRRRVIDFKGLAVILCVEIMCVEHVQMYIAKRRRKLWAIHDVPASLHQAVGRRRFAESLGTDDPRVAERRAAALKALWLSEIDRARATSGVQRERDAEWWRNVLESEKTEAGKEIIRDLIASEAQDKVESAASKAGITDTRDPRYAELPELADAVRFVDIATGKLVKLDEHLEAYLSLCIDLKPATIEQRRSTVLRFGKDAGFIYIADLTKKGVQQWANSQAAAGQSIKTTRRNLSELRGYWKYLQSLELAPDAMSPFDGLKLVGHKGRDREAFTPADVVRLRQEAHTKGNTALADLIELLMYTGCRREEICSLKVEHVSLSNQSFDVKQAKTKAGIRTVPIHSSIKATVERLCAASTDGYLISGLRRDKRGLGGDRIGGAFTVLKRKLGHGNSLTMHSIRHTVLTMLEDAGVLPGVYSDLLGHAKQGMTRIYSGGVSLQTKREAMEKLVYPR